jgi:hypothetical protein
VTLVALGAASVSPALAQSGSYSGQQGPPPAQRQNDDARPRDQRQMPRADRQGRSEMKELTGTVRQVDEESSALRVSGGVLGLGDTTLQVTDHTRIQVEGREGALTDLREGTRIRASYEDRQGINVARSIEVTPSEQQETPRSPGGSTPSGPAGQTSGARPSGSGQSGGAPSRSGS